MKLEWDEAKRDKTLQERGLDFATVAEAEWDNTLTAGDARMEYGERRFVSLVPIDQHVCVIV